MNLGGVFCKGLKDFFGSYFRVICQRFLEAFLQKNNFFERIFREILPNLQEIIGDLFEKNLVGFKKDI